MGEVEDKEIERRVDYKVLSMKIDNLVVGFTEVKESIQTSQKEWTDFKIARAKENHEERICELERKPKNTEKAWERRLTIAALVISIGLSATAIIYSIATRNISPIINSGQTMETGK